MELAIAGCWLWVPSLPDVRKTIGAARQILEPELLRARRCPPSRMPTCCTCAGPTASSRARPANRSCQATNRVKPGTTETLDLTVPPALASTYRFASPVTVDQLHTGVTKDPVIGFVLD